MTLLEARADWKGKECGAKEEEEGIKNAI